jgi:hypothetical protein
MNLIYMCVFYQLEYIKLLNLLILSISEKANLNKETTHILIITSPLFHPLIKKHLDIYDLPLEYYILNINTLMESSCCKLNIFQYDKIDKYKKILYLDTDNEILSDKLYALEEGKIESEYHGGQFFDFTKFNKTTNSFSAGVFFFMNSLSIKKLFEDTNIHIKNYQCKNKTIPTCLDQPFLVYNSFIQDKYDNQFMKKYVENNPNIVKNEKIIYHFPGGPGHFPSKYTKMTLFWEIIKINRLE